VYEFPIDQGLTRPATQVSGWEQLAFLAMIQREWADAAPSATIYVRPEESGDIEHMLAQFAPVLKSVSLKLHTPAGEYPQMPYEEITKEEYEKRRGVLRPLEEARVSGADDAHRAGFCDGDSCVL